MKKLLGILVLGLLLVSCSENNKKRMLENCADLQDGDKAAEGAKYKIFRDLENKIVDVDKKFSNLYAYVQKLKEDENIRTGSEPLFFPDLRIQKDKENYSDFEKKVSNEVNLMYQRWNKNSKNYYLNTSTYDKLSKKRYEKNFDYCETEQKKHPNKFKILYEKRKFYQIKILKPLPL